MSMDRTFVRSSIGVGAVLLTLSLAACVEVGRDFVRPDPQSIAPKKTTKADILRQFGKPYSTGQFSRNSQFVDSLHYYYGVHESGGNFMYKKHCWFYFVGDAFVGYSFVTGLPIEQRNFDAKKVPSIVKGKTTRTEIISMFGTPSGVLEFPATDEKKTVEGDSAIQYQYYVRSSEDDIFVYKFLVVSFDPNGIAKDVDLDVSQKTTDSAGSSAASRSAADSAGTSAASRLPD
jgi:hypothetical protein